MKKTILTLLIGLLTIPTFSQNTKLLRFPDIHEDKIVFSYAGNLYSVEKPGGIARRLTDHKGYEMFPHFSPDGSKIAFTAHYDGNTEVYVMPAEGGTPTRITYTATLSRDDVTDRMGPNNIVMGWTPDGNNVIFRSRMKSFNSFVGQLFKAPVDGGLPEQIEVPRGGWNDFINDGEQMVYNRVFREFRTWKYYRGGMADDLWLHDFTDHSTKRLFENDAQDIFPMCVNGLIYFLSDRDRTMNLFVFDPESEDTRKLTQFSDYDIKFPNHDDHTIIFEQAGEIHCFDISKEETTKINIRIAEDFANSRASMKDASELIRDVSLAPDGNRVVLSGRGDIFTLPANKGVTKRLTETNGVHERDPVWSPDGKYIAYWSDETGEYEIYLQDKDNKKPAEKITSNNDTYPYQLTWSPDSKKIIWSDKKLRLRYIDIESKNITEITTSDYGDIRDYTWSPDSKWVAFADADENRMNRIYLYGTQDEEITPVTSKWYDSSNPEFSTSGSLLFFTSNRDFNPIYSQTEWNHAYRDMSRIYYVTLSEENPDPLAPQNDTVRVESSDTDDNNNEKSDKSSKNIKVDTEGIADRINVLPVDAASYWSLNHADNKLYYIQNKLKHKSKLNYFDFDTREEKEIGESMGYTISANHKKMLIRKSGKYYVIDLPSSSPKLKDPVDKSDMSIHINLHDEWSQVFHEAWRQMRDFFYDPGMHGVDWEAMKDKYKVFLPYLNHRNDLTYIIGEMIAELNVGHAYVGGGDRDKPEKIYTGLLGAEFAKDKSGYFKITKLLKGKNWNDEYIAPLTGIGKNISEGDYIISIDGHTTKNTNNIYTLLTGKAGKKTVIAVNDKPSEKNSKEYIIEPVKDEAKLYYYQWVQDNINKVAEATDGKVGYIHIPNMITEGLNEFVKHFYPQLTKEALIIDDRGNGGGNVSPMIIERLRRELAMMGMGRNVTKPGTRPRGMHVGPKVLLVDQYSASDGDLFPYQFRKYDLGPIIGVRTWGGVVGIRGSLPFVDGGTLRKPEFAHYAADTSKWIIEGHGVEPDIEVWNDPWKEFNGKDQQLNKAIDIALKKLEDNPPVIPGVPDFPDKSE